MTTIELRTSITAELDQMSAEMKRIFVDANIVIDLLCERYIFATLS